MVEIYRVELDPSAERDLAAIRDYIVKRGAPETAVKFVNRLMNEIHTLEILPKGHQRRRKSRKSPHPLWQLPVDSYRVIYTIFEERKVVRVLGVQHGGRRTWP